jgi:hypothetical protein
MREPLLPKTKGSPQRARIPPENNLPKQILLFLLAVIPALLLGYLLMYGASTLEMRQKQKEELYNRYLENQIDYGTYEEQLRQMNAQEEQHQKDMWGALHKINQNLVDQKEFLQIQQDQLKQEQKRIKMLLQQSKRI